MIDSSLVFHVLIAFGAFQALFISIIILTQGQSSLPKKFFAFFLIIEGITLIERLLAETELINSVPHLLGVSYPISFIKPLLLFLMALAIVNKKFKLRKVHAWHLIPFFIILITNLPFYFMDAGKKLELVREFLHKTPVYLSVEFFLSLSFFLYIGIYMAATIITLRRYKKHVKNNRLANWHLYVLSLYAVLLLIHLAYFLIQPSGVLEIPLFNTISMLIMTFLIQSIAYSFISRADIFNNNNAPDLSNVDQLVKDEQLIRDKLKRDKVYLDDTLNLDDFARSVDLSKKYVSELINQRFGLPFKDLISQYRVNEAKEIMKQERHSNMSLIDMAYDSGFNNKVSFYRSFKRHTGKSPSEYFDDLKDSTTAI